MQMAQAETLLEGFDCDCEYGDSHREYVINKLREKGITDPESQADQEFLASRERAKRFADEEARDRARNRACTILKNHKQISDMLSDKSNAQSMPVSSASKVDPRFGSKIPCDSGADGQFKKIPTPEYKETMTNHTRSCNHQDCKRLWQGPWGTFIGGERGSTHFDLTECPEGRQMNQSIGWNYDNPTC